MMPVPRKSSNFFAAENAPGLPVVSLVPAAASQFSSRRLSVLLAAMKTVWKMLLTPFLALIMLACSSSPSGGGASTPASAPLKPAEPKATDTESGRVIFQRLYTTSRGWASDTQPVNLQSQNSKHAGGNENAPLGHDGKSAIWRGVFASAARHSMKTYMWSGLTGPDAPSPGITPGSEDSWSATNTSTEPFQLVYLKFDSDQAFQTAQKHGGVALLKKTSDLPVNFRLSWEPRKTMLVWHVVYGQSINDPQLDVVVDATTNQYVRVEK